MDVGLIPSKLLCNNYNEPSTQQQLKLLRFTCDIMAELLSAFFASVFTAKADHQASQSLELSEKAWRKEDLPLVKEDWSKRTGLEII